MKMEAGEQPKNEAAMMKMEAGGETCGRFPAFTPLTSAGGTTAMSVNLRNNHAPARTWLAELWPRCARGGVADEADRA